MKFIIILAALFFNHICIAQNGKISNDTLYISGYSFIKNTTIEIGKGSKSDGSYSYLFVPPQKVGRQVSLPVPLTAGWAGYNMKIVDFKQHGNETMGIRYYLILSAGVKKVFYWCDPLLAIEAKEIL